MTSHARNAFIYATIVAMGGLLFGLDAVLISGGIADIATEFSLDSNQIGNIVSGPALGVLIALPFAGYISNAFGRKSAIMLVAILYLVSAISSALAPSYQTLWAARFLGGLAFSSISLASMYIGEVAPPRWRGKLVSMTQINIVIGLSGAYFISYLIHHWAISGADWATSIGLTEPNAWRWMLGAEVPFALLWFGLLLFIPESPAWFAYKNRKEDARRTLQYLMPAEEIDRHVEEMSESLQKSSEDHSIVSQMQEIFAKPMRLTFIIALTIAIAQQTTGVNAILFYAHTVFKQLGLGVDAAFTQAIWVGITGLIFTALGLLLVDKLGRRPLIIWGMVWIIASLGICAYAFHEARYVLSQETLAELSEATSESGETAKEPKIKDANRLNALADKEFVSDIAFKKAIEEALGKEDSKQHLGLLLEKSANINATLILIGILSFIGAFHFSVGPVMWVLFSEIFPISVRGIAIPFFTIITSTTSWLVQKFFPWQLENWGMSSILMFYAGTVTIGLIILFFTLVETKNMSIEKIQKKLTSNG